MNVLLKGLSMRMNLLIPGLVFIWMGTGFAGGVIPPRQDPNNPEFVPGEVIVKFKDDVQLQLGKRNGIAQTGISSLDKLHSEMEVSEMEAVFKGAKKRTLNKQIRTHTGETIEVPQLFNIYKLKVPEDADIEEIVDAYKNDPNVEYAEPNYIAQIAAIPDDPDYSLQWGLAAIRAPEAWEIETGDSNVVIGILDTGVEWDHPDLMDKIWVNQAELNGIEGVDDDGNGYVDDIRGWNWIRDNDDPYDDNGHGTHVAGIAAASTDNGIGIAGMSWGSKIMVLKVLSHTGTGTYTDLAQAVYYAATEGAKVINMSLGGYADSYTLKTALEDAYTTSIIVAAAGNDFRSVDKTSRSPGFPFFPAAYSFVVGVTAADAGFSNYDPNGATATNNGFNYEVGAPGVGIYSTMIAHSYASWNGTSMAAPFVSGTVALLRSYYPDWSNELLIGQLIQTSGSMIDAHAALTSTPVPVLVSMGYAVTDTLPGDDRDGIADAGETVELVFTVKNFWAQADTVEMRLRLMRPWRDSAYVTIVDSIATFGGISAYATDNNADNPFVLDIAGITPNNSNILMEYTITCANSETVWSDTLWLQTQRGTEISGIISENTTLSNDYLYIVTGNMLVESGVTLTIEPGTRIQFNADKYLRIDGTLVAIGTPDSMIVFTSNVQTHQPGDWAGIHFNGAVDAVFDTNGNYLSGSIIKYAEIELGRGIRIGSCSPYIAHSLIHDHSTSITLGGAGSGIRLISSNSRIEHNVILGNYSSAGNCGGYGAGIGIDGGAPYIAYNIIEGNYRACSGGGIGLTSSSHSAIVTHNVIRGNWASSYDYKWGGGGLFMGNGTVTKNVIYDNYAKKWGSNPAFPYAGGIRITGGAFYNNTVMNNKYDGIFSEQGWPVTIYSNNIIDNRRADPLYDQYEYYDFRMGPQYVSGISAQNNYWGTTNSDTIADRVWDFLDDFGLGLLTYQPFDSMPIVDAPGFLYDVELNPISPIGIETVSFDLIFSKPMNIGIQPNVKFGVTDPYTQHVIEGAWVDSTRWQGAYSFNITTGDGINRLRVTQARDNEGMEIPKDTRFAFIVDATGASSEGFVAQAGIGKVDLSWRGTEMVDLMGYNMRRYHRINDSTYSDIILINTSMITDTSYTDFSVEPDVTYFYKYTAISTDFVESAYSDPATATPFDAAPGDANGDLSVDVLDIITIVSYMLMNNPEPFLFDAADINNDTVINVLDIIGAVNIILGRPKLAAWVDAEEAVFSLKNDELMVSSDGLIAGYQFKVGGKVRGLGVSSLYPMEVATKRLSSDTLLVVVYSLSRETIPAGNNSVLTFSRSEGIALSDLVVSNRSGGKVEARFGRPGELIVPEEFALSQNYPNPFNSITTINYELPEVSDIRLVIYNILGQVVTTHDRMNVRPGYHSYAWNGKNRQGGTVSSGVYIYRLKAGIHTATKKMILLK